MPPLTLATAESMLATWIEAEQKVASGQKFSIEVDGSRRELERADLEMIGKRIEFWNGKVIAFTRRANGRSNSRTIVN